MLLKPECKKVYFFCHIMQSLNVNVKPKLIITISMYTKLFFSYSEEKYTGNSFQYIWTATCPSPCRHWPSRLGFFKGIWKLNAQVSPNADQSLEATSHSYFSYCKPHSVFFNPFPSHQWTASNIKEIPLQCLNWDKKKKNNKTNENNSKGVENWPISSEGNYYLIICLYGDKKVVQNYNWTSSKVLNSGKTTRAALYISASLFNLPRSWRKQHIVLCNMWCCGLLNLDAKQSELVPIKFCAAKTKRAFRTHTSTGYHHHTVGCKIDEVTFWYQACHQSWLCHLFDDM